MMTPPYLEISKAVKLACPDNHVLHPFMARLLEPLCLFEHCHVKKTCQARQCTKCCVSFSTAWALLQNRNHLRADYKEVHPPETLNRTYHYPIQVSITSNMIQP